MPLLPANRVLIADDEPSICELCFRVLSRYGLEVDCSRDGQEVWQRTTQADYAVIILDIRMPVSSGKEILQRLKHERPDLVERVILISGDLMNEDTTAFVRAMARPFLAKPFTPDELLAVVRKLYDALYPDDARVHFP